MVALAGCSNLNREECTTGATAVATPQKDPAQLNAALVIHLPLPIYNVRGASLH